MASLRPRSTRWRLFAACLLPTAIPVLFTAACGPEARSDAPAAEPADSIPAGPASHGRPASSATETPGRASGCPGAVTSTRW